MWSRKEMRREEKRTWNWIVEEWREERMWYDRKGYRVDNRVEENRIE